MKSEGIMLKLHPVSGRGPFLAKSFISLLFLSLGVLGCAGSNYVTVRVPPEVDLRSYEAVGIIELGSNADAAVFEGNIKFSEPKVNMGGGITDLATAQGGVRAEMRGDMFARLVETKTAASVWSNSSWVTKQLGGVHVSSDGGIAGTVRSSNPREEMVPGLIREVLTGLRESTVRRRID